MRATLIAGLPGSGKTTLARGLASSVQGAVLLDDPDTIEALDRILPSTPLAVITHPAFCEPSARLRVEREILRRNPTAELEWIFFANDPDPCRRNVRQRADGRGVMGYISALSRMYEIPGDADVRPVFQGIHVEDAPVHTP